MIHTPLVVVHGATLLSPRSTPLALPTPLVVYAAWYAVRYVL